MTHATPERPSALRIWWLAARPKTLGAAMAPVLLGTALAAVEGPLHLPSVLLCFAGALLLQIGTNYCNDLADFLKGTDKDRIGPIRATQAGWVTPGQMKLATQLVFAAAALVCAGLVARAGWPLVLIGITSILAGVLYTAGPYPLAYLGLGDLFVLIFFGPVAVAGTTYVQTLTFAWTPIWLGFGPGLLSVGILIANNFRDLDGDRLAGKKTLAVRFGVTFTRLQYTVCLLIAGLLPWWVYPEGAMTGPLRMLLLLGASLLVLIPIPFVWKHEGRALNPLLARTARVLMGYCLLVALAWGIPA